MKRLVLLTVGIWVLAAPTAQADYAEPYAGWVASFATPMPPVSVEVRVEPGACNQEGNACTGPGDPIWFDTENGIWPDRWALAHEEGHQFDYQAMPEWARERFEALVGDFRPWTEGPNAPNEKFAEGYAWCALHPRLAHRPLTYTYEYRPSPALHRKVCRMIATVGTTT